MNKCPNCKKEKMLSPFEGPVKAHGIEVLGHGARCSACGETYFELAELERHETIAAAKIVERGVRTAIEFKFVRKMTGIQANELADLLDVRPETVSRWEQGKTEIPRAAAFALGELYARPRVIRERLAAFATVIEISPPKRTEARRTSARAREMARTLATNIKSPAGTPVARPKQQHRKLSKQSG